MKKLLSLAISLFFMLNVISALDVSCTYASFNALEFNYTEIYITVIGSTIDYEPLKNDTTQFQGAVNVLLLIKQGDKIIKVEKYNMSSPITQRAINFMDIKRFQLDEGSYELELAVTDVLDETNKMIYNSSFKVGFPKKKISQSDILLLSSYKKDDSNSPFVKNGYYLEIAPFNFYHKKTSKLVFYNEIYNTIGLKKEAFFVTYEIEKVFGNGKTKSVLVGHKKRMTKQVDVLLSSMDISTLASGNYRLKITIRDAEQNLLSGKQIDFYRSNPILDQKLDNNIDVSSDSNFAKELTIDELRYSLKAIGPLFEDEEASIINAIIKSRNSKSHSNYLYTYWAKKSPINPKAAYDEYMTVARAIDNTFKSGFGYGFETDRGRVYLRYGAPSQREETLDDPFAPPYEVWTYNEVKKLNQNNVSFLFYNPSLATGDFLLLHSNAKGEIRNDDWIDVLYKDAANIQNGGGLEGVLNAFGADAKRAIRRN